jgi:hypothetical protein
MAEVKSEVKKVINPDEKEALVPFSAGPTYKPKSPDEVLEDGEGTTKMHFPTNVMITTNERVIVKFAKGVQQVPNHLVNHVALKRAGVKIHKAEARQAPLANAAQQKEEVPAKK